MSTMAKQVDGGMAHRTARDHVADTVAALENEASAHEAAAQVLRDAIEKLQAIEGGSQIVPIRSETGPYRYVNMDMVDALKKYLGRSQKPATRDELIKEMLAGGIYTGKYEGNPQGAEVQAKKAIDYAVTTWKEREDNLHRKFKKFDSPFKRIGALDSNYTVGLADWPESMFRGK